MSVAHAEPTTIELDAARQFDFWLGEWDCTWHQDGLEHVGTNSVYADLGGMVVVENFDGRPSLDYQGLSYSVYDRKAHCWKQTWVDSEGSTSTSPAATRTVRWSCAAPPTGRSSGCAGRTSSRLARLVGQRSDDGGASLDDSLGDRVHPCRIAGSTRLRGALRTPRRRLGSGSCCGALEPSPRHAAAGWRRRRVPRADPDRRAARRSSSRFGAAAKRAHPRREWPIPLLLVGRLEGALARGDRRVPVSRGRRMALP